MTAISDPAFPFRAPALQDHGVSSNAWVLSQDAELHLRGGVRARVTWPPATAAERPPLLVLVPATGERADPDLCHELAIRIPAVVLAAAPGPSPPPARRSNGVPTTPGSWALTPIGSCSPATIAAPPWWPPSPAMRATADGRRSRTSS